MIYYIFITYILKAAEIGMLSGQVLEMINNPHYLYRMTILRAISLLAPVMGSEITCSKLLPVVINASKDRYILDSRAMYLLVVKI